MRSIVIIELLDGSSTSFAKQTAGSIVRRLDTWRREDSERQSSTGGQEDSGEITTESTYAGVGRQVAHVEADGFGEIREKHLR